MGMKQGLSTLYSVSAHGAVWTALSLSRRHFPCRFVLNRAVTFDVSSENSLRNPPLRCPPEISLRTTFRGFAKGWFPKGWFWRMFPGPRKPERGYKKTERRTPKTGARVQKRSDSTKHRNKGTLAKTTLNYKTAMHCFLSNFYGHCPYNLSEKYWQYTSNLYHSTPPICNAVPCWLQSFGERETPQYTSNFYCSTPPICTAAPLPYAPAILLRKYRGLGFRKVPDLSPLRACLSRFLGKWVRRSTSVKKRACQ